MAAYDVIVVGAGNAALCAALAANDEGARVLMVERASRVCRGGNSRHVRNFRDAHLVADDYVSGPYGVDEFLDDLIGVTGHDGDPVLTRLLISESLDIASWAWAHGVRWQPPLRGTLSLSRTNRFFLGGGKALLNAYYLTAASRGVAIAYDTTVTDLAFDGNRCRGVIIEHAGQLSEVAARSVVVAAGGFEANRVWLRGQWGDAADQFGIRGTRLNDGLVLMRLFGHGARAVGDPTRFHAIAVDARAPMYDAGILSRLDAIPYGIVVNRECQRFYDEGEDIWPKRYAIWGRLIAEQPGQTAAVILDAKSIDRFIPPLIRPLVGPTIGDIAELLGLNAASLVTTVESYNRHVSPAGTFTDGILDDCRTVDLAPAKSHWARRLDTPPYYAFPLRTGVTFTYHGVQIDEETRVIGADGPFENLYAAGEIMAGNILTRGYLAGIGMTIGTVFGRRAGRAAARHD